jgi:hypothetical protein
MTEYGRNESGVAIHFEDKDTFAIEPLRKWCKQEVYEREP